MNFPPKFIFFNRKCPYCGAAISFLNSFCVDCFNAVVLPNREREKAVKVEKDMQEARLNKVKQ